MVEDERPQSRRSFLNTLIGGVTFLLATGGVYVGGRYLWPRAAGSAGGKERVDAGPAKDLPVGRGKKVVYQNKPVWVIHAPFGFVALSAVCTHLGCIVEYDEQKGIWCPCHAAFFDLRGNVKSGPAPRPLPAFRVAVVGGNVVVGES